MFEIFFVHIVINLKLELVHRLSSLGFNLSVLYFYE